MAKREPGSRRTTEKDGGSDEDAAGSVGKRIQMGGGGFTKVETAKRTDRPGSQKGETELK